MTRVGAALVRTITSIGGRSGQEIAPNTVASATKIIVLATKI